MNPAESNPADSPDDALDERLGELINEFFDRRSRGESVSEEQFLAENPQHAEVLRQHLGGLHLLSSLGGAKGSSAAHDTIARPPSGPFHGSSAVVSSGESAQPIPEITGYDVQKPIGRGGMGLVYRAIQLSTKRVVALKVLLEGPFATDTARKRFEREISLAAQLRHPNIIPIYDSGTSNGRMYYAMEYIYGLPLNEYLRVHKLDVRGSLSLLLKVFTAVGHAHQRGVIHRDLKPSNILVDGDGEPHILDFGLAKAGALGDVTTSISAPIIGTPAYMSPEQASADPNSVDIRTDVYSLGVVLYESVCKKFPYETSGSIGKALHNIAHAEPVFPSRQNPKVDAELSAIAMKSLEKNKDNRYQSVDSFSQDLRRYLAGEPISAKQATSAYLLKKAVLKHRGLVGACAALFVVFVASWWAIRQFSRVSTEKEGLHQRLAQVEEDAAKKDAAIQELVRQTTPGTGTDVITETVLSALKPEDAAIMKMFTKGKTQEEALIAIAAMLANALPESAAATEDTNFKSPNIEQFDRPLSSPRPDKHGATSKPTLKPEEYQRIIKLLQESAIRAATAEQAASQPSHAADAAPATTQPAETKSSRQNEAASQPGGS